MLCGFLLAWLNHNLECPAVSPVVVTLFFSEILIIYIKPTHMYKVRMTLSSAIDGGADQTSKRRCLTPIQGAISALKATSAPTVLKVVPLVGLRGALGPPQHTLIIRNQPPAIDSTNQ